jgi:site-specific DNA-adenine methylase
MTNNIERITFPYPGGKARLAPALVAMMPQNGRLYLEPFAGRGNVFFRAAQILKFPTLAPKRHSTGSVLSGYQTLR